MAASAPSPKASPAARKKFRFDQKLWRQFIEIAQPYFYPLESNGTRRFFALLVIQLLCVIAFTFFFVVTLALGGLYAFPQFFKRMIDDVNFLEFLKSFVDFQDMAEKAGIGGDAIAEAFRIDLSEQAFSWDAFGEQVNRLSSSVFEPVAGSEVAQRIIQGLLGSPIFYTALGVLVFGALAFFVSRSRIAGRWWQWGMLSVILFLAFLVSGLNVVISYSFRFIDNAFVSFAEAKVPPDTVDEAVLKASEVARQAARDEFWQFLSVYGVILILAIPIIIGYIYLQRKLALKWREWLTKSFFSEYFKDRSYYELDSNAANTAIDNPDQRMTEDVESFTTTVLSFLLDILTSVLDLLAFTGILYGISRELTLGLAGYAAVGTFLAVFIGTRLIKINFEQLRYEANLRYGMVHMRDNAESIAFYRGESLERKQVDNRLAQAIENFNLKIIWLALLGVFQRAYSYFARLVPYVIVAPIFFADNIDYGAIGQATFAFSMVLSALSLITNRIQEISRFAASVSRIGELYEHFRNNKEGSRGQSEGSTIQTHLSTQFKANDLTLRTPNGEQTLFENMNLELEPQEQLLIVGASGCGKSSMMRALAGLWKNGAGSIERPDNSEILFLPQKPYMLLGTLREQLMYPNMREAVSDREISEALTLVNLEELPERVGGLDSEKDWPSVLSLGEQQRLAFARILLNHPKYVMLDEATSALDVSNERRLYELLRSLDILYISVGHRPNLKDYHRKVLEIGAGEQGWLVMDAADYQFNEAS